MSGGGGARKAKQRRGMVMMEETPQRERALGRGCSAKALRVDMW